MQREYKISLSQEFYSDVVYLSQYDSDYDVIFKVMNKHSAVDVNGKSAKFTGTRKDGLGFTFEAVGIGSYVSFEINTSLTAVAGHHTAEIVFYDSQGLYFGSANVQVVVEPAARKDGTIDADTKRAQEIAEEIQEIVDTAAAEVKGEAESWAVGERDGEPVPATDPTYQNNAKFYAEQAQEIADSIGIDATLSVSGKAADAKKTGDEISSLKEDLTFSTGNTEIAFTKGAYIKTNTTPIDISSPVTDSAFKYAVIDCSAGDVFTLTAQGAGSARAFAFLNSTNTPLWMSASGYIANNLIIVAPIGATHLVINDRVANNTRSYYGAAIKDAVVYEDGEEQIKTPNIEGMVKTNNTVLSNNLFSKATLLRSGYYVGISSGQISFTSNASYDTYIMPVDGSTYNFTNVRFGVKLRADQTIAVGETITNATSVDTSGAEYFAWSFNPTTYPTSAFEVKKRMNTYKIPVDWDLSANVEEKTPYGKASGTLANGEYIEISGRSALKDGEKIIFKGVLSSFSSLRLGFMYAGGVSNYIDVDATNITIKNSTDAATINAHGLTIVNDITIIVEFIRGDAKISVISNGNIYTTTVAWVQISAVASSPRITSTNTVCTYAELRTVYDAISRDVWYFGDSYISFNNAQRWVYYLKEYGFDTNILLSGSAGCSSAITRTAIETLLKYGTPKIAVMATGMNDGSDNGDTPASTWVSNRDYFLSNCQTADAEPIFCTIPTTPTVNNEAKNAWVKNSGYQYIDFAKAVGAQADGTWYSGMLASDNVHPTELGARALFSQVLIDLPEVMLT